MSNGPLSTDPVYAETNSFDSRDTPYKAKSNMKTIIVITEIILTANAIPLVRRWLE